MENYGIMSIPGMCVPGAEKAQTLAYGSNNYVTTVEGTRKADYDAYLQQLLACGFVKYADNGAGLGGTVYCTTFTRGDLVLTVAFYSMEQKTSISFYEGPVSERLRWQDSYVAGNRPGAKTKIHMQELWRFGNSFVFQLKNGHFVLSDGGLRADLPYLLDYLESLVPAGEKPVIEGWIISHAHGDHCGALSEFDSHPEWRDRILCDGIYFCEPHEKVLYRCGDVRVCANIKMAARWLTTSTGTVTPFYRPQTGQRYYFNDMTMDILLCQEQVPFEVFGGDLNTSSTVCLFTIEEQKCFFSGDIHQEGLTFIMENYTREFLDLTLFTMNHHGYNTCTQFADYATIQTALLTVQKRLPVRQVRENRYFLSRVQETMMWGTGTKILTFPYEMGSYECLPNKEWIYNEGEERILQPNMYTFPGRTLRGFIFDGDAVVFDKEEVKTGVKELLDYLKDKKVRMSVYSAEPVEALKRKLKKQQLEGYFDLVLGGDQLKEENPALDAMDQSEAAFWLDHVHKYLVVCNDLKTVETAVSTGFRSLILAKDCKEKTEAGALSPELELKCWKYVDTPADAIELFQNYKIYPTHKDTGISFE